VAGCVRDWIGLGLDVELCGGFPAEIASLVCSDEERASSAHWPVGLDIIALTFSAKESVFKCYYPLERKFLDFLDVVIRWRPHGDERDLGCFDAFFSTAVENLQRPIEIEGRWQIDGGRIHTSAFVRAVSTRSQLKPETSPELGVVSDVPSEAEVGQGDAT
jgi:4'-phosphopantetheinyl transferase EntD